MQSLTLIFLGATAAIVFVIVVVYIHSLVTKNKYNKPRIIFKKYAKKQKLQPPQRGIIAGTSYLQYSTDTTQIISMTLTCSFMTHIYCFVGVQMERIDQHLAEKTNLTRVISNLMPSGFNIYCNEEDIDNLKKIFDTQVLSYLSEFCQFYDLEIADNQVVYALKPNFPDKNNQAALMEDGALLYNLVNPKIIEWYRQIQDEFTDKFKTF